MDNHRILVLGSGSWGTALVKILLNNEKSISWYVRNPESVNYLKEHKTNPNYLTSLKLETERITFYSDIKTAIDNADIIFLSIPSAFMKMELEGKGISLQGKFIVSAVKGIIPEDNLIITEYLSQYFKVSYLNMAVISGPSHAEEIASEMLTYLTIACRRTGKIKRITNLIECDYVRTIESKDVLGIEYAGVLKNIIAIASGICHGLGYGDNFQAVLISNAIREIKRFLNKVSTRKREIDSSVYLGDLLVTTYSQFSRNRTLGTMIGKGYSVKTALLEMNMVSEGYYASKCFNVVNRKQYGVYMPICDAVFRIMHENVNAKEEIKRLDLLMH